MARRPSLARRLVTTASWPFGIALTSWNYLWRTTPMHRSEVPGSPEQDAPPPLPDGLDRGDLQPDGDGVGPLYHRRYRARIAEAALSADELMARIQADPNCVSPTEFARFLRTSGDDGRLRAGDELVVRMPGPWDGPVRVVDVTPTSFRLATMRGHLEAGQIEFRADDGPGPLLSFTIESWARSGDRLSNLLYEHVRMAKEIQLHMWTSVLEQAARLAGGRLVGGVEIRTRRLVLGEARAHLLSSPAARDALDGLHERALNFELGATERPEDEGWHVDDFRQALPSEEPGEPVPGGSFEIAKRLIREYEFADPSIVRAVYHADRPLEERDMLLELRFYALRFHVGVRVGGVRDGVVEVNGRRARVYGWNYRTLEGHVEEGQRDYEVWKWLDTGEVEFRTHAFSRSSSGNPLLRLGFRVFGRREQVKFARRACRRMDRLVRAELEDAAIAEAVPRVADSLAVRPAAEA